MDYVIPSIIGTILVVGAAGAASFRATWLVAEPNQALIISGLKQKGGDGLGFHIVTGGGALVVPGLQRARRLSLGLREAVLATDCVTTQGIPVGIRGVAMFKIADDDASIANAARRFLDQPDDAITGNIQTLFDGHLRSIVGGMTVEDLIRNRDALTTEARKTASDDMQRFGLVLDSLQIKDITDPSGYIKNLALPHVAEVQKAARIAQANADQEATLVEQDAQAKKSAAIRDTNIKTATYQAEIDQAKAKAAQAGPLADATAKQDVTRAETITAQLNADLAEQRLQAEVRKPADAQAYAIQVKASAERDASIRAAEAEAQRITLDANAKATWARVTGEAEGSAIQARGLAEAEITKAKLLAEADGIRARAEALASNQEGVINQMIAEKMPEIVASAAGAYNNVKNLTVLDGAQGVSRGLGTIVGMASTLGPIIKDAISSLKNVVTVKKGEVQE